MSRFNEDGSEYFGADDARDFLFAINAGHISGHRQVRTFGFNPDLDSGGTEYMWDVGVEPNYDSANTNMYIVSSSVTDMQLITVYGLVQDLNGNWNEQTITTALNGTTPVLLNAQFIRILKAYNANGLLLTGNVYVTKANALPTLDSDINIRAKINISEETTHMAMFTVPSGYTAFVYRLYHGVRRNEDAVFNFQSRLFGKVFRSFGKVTSYQSSQQLELAYEKFVEKTDFRIRVTTLTNNTEASASMHMLLVENKKLGN